jgi:tetratricopeptide (TPR) repeat protein
MFARSSHFESDTRTWYIVTRPIFHGSDGTDRGRYRVPRAPTTCVCTPVAKKSPDQKINALPPIERRWFFAFTVMFPFLLLLLLELILTAVRYGPDMSLFTKEIIAGNEYLIMNPEVKSRYFTKVEFSPNTSPDYFKMPKPQGTYRIFCLGGSTTVGFPYGYVGSFSTYLRDRLKYIFPDRTIEVINLGMTATNSFTTLDIARELVDYAPDMFCVYDGHNEFYGALGIASHESVGGSRWLVKLHLRLIHFRSYVFFRDLFGAIAHFFSGAENAGDHGTMMERLALGKYIPYRSALYTNALDDFRANMEDLRTLCQRRGILLLLSSQVSNLRDQPPFVSGDFRNPDPAAMLRYNLQFNRGVTFLLDSRPDSALAAFSLLMPVDSLRADLRFQRARCLDSLGRKEEARQEYECARDLDQLRFRTSSDFNDAIRNAADGKTSFFVDMERKFRANSTDSLIGKSLILEHLHPNARGYFLMAKEYTHIMHLYGLVESQDKWNERDRFDDDSLWARRPMTLLDSLCAARRIAQLTSGWPFRSNVRELDPVRAEDTLGTIVGEMVSGRISWEQGHVAAVQFFQNRRMWEMSERELKVLINQIPLNVSAYLLLGKQYLNLGMNMEAAGVLLASTKVEQTFFANRALGILALEPQVAIPFLERALTFDQPAATKADVAALLADTFLRAGRTQDALTQASTAIQWDPTNAQARRLLAQLRKQ